MTARWALAVATIVLLAGSGCCGGPCGGMACGDGMACGNGCPPLLPRPIVYPGSMDCEGCDSTAAWCRPAGGQASWGGACSSCNTGGSPCGGIGLLNFLRCRTTACKGCGEVYYGEWLSDPPDCCDPCDACTGDFTGPQGCCGPGLLGRFWLGLTGGNRLGGCGCGPVGGGGGCDSCGGGMHSEHMMMHGGHGMPGHIGSQSILDENWDLPPEPKPVPGKPIHKAQAAPQKRVSSAAPAHRPTVAAATRPVAGNGFRPVAGRMSSMMR